MLMPVFGFLVPWSTLASTIRRCVREKNTTLFDSAPTMSVESTTKTVVCGTVDPAGSPALAEMAVALEEACPCEVAVGPSQQAFGGSGSDVASSQVAVFVMEGVAVVLAPRVVLRSPRSLSCPVGSAAGAAVDRSRASSAVPIVREGAAVENEPQCEPVDETMGLVEGPV